MPWSKKAPAPQEEPQRAYWEIERAAIENAYKEFADAVAKKSAAAVLFQYAEVAGVFIIPAEGLKYAGNRQFSEGLCVEFKDGGEIRFAQDKVLAWFMPGLSGGGED